MSVVVVVVLDGSSGVGADAAVGRVSDITSVGVNGAVGEEESVAEMESSVSRSLAH